MNLFKVDDHMINNMYILSAAAMLLNDFRRTIRAAA